mmetsp:Transcript_20085/g.35801  ORF Transcript_20085/g.35801 Transcript_20085/m.35801 type:complete len:261 (-) Transcript_20085:607-1389(-)
MPRSWGDSLSSTFQGVPSTTASISRHWAAEPEGAHHSLPQRAQPALEWHLTVDVISTHLPAGEVKPEVVVAAVQVVIIVRQAVQLRPQTVVHSGAGVGGDVSASRAVVRSRAHRAASRVALRPCHWLATECCQAGIGTPVGVLGSWLLTSSLGGRHRGTMHRGIVRARALERYKITCCGLGAVKCELELDVGLDAEEVPDVLRKIVHAVFVLVVHADVVLLPVAADRDDEGRLGRLHLRSQSRPPIGQLVVAKPAVRLFL